MPFAYQEHETLSTYLPIMMKISRENLTPLLSKPQFSGIHLMLSVKYTCWLNLLIFFLSYFVYSEGIVNKDKERDRSSFHRFTP